jgi:hypothetical protein
MPRLSLIVLILAAALGGLPARADELYAYAEMVCDPAKDIAVARFTNAWNDEPPAYAPLPAKVDGGLSALPPTEERQCALANGWEIKLKVGHEQVVAYGMGRVSAPSFFSLWVDRRKVLSRRVFSPSDPTDTWSRPVAVVVADDALTVCSQTGASPVDCVASPFDPATLPVDVVEYPPPRAEPPPVGTILVTRGTENALCQDILAAKDPFGQPSDYEAEGWTNRTVFPGRRAVLPPGPIDFDGDGEPDTAVGLGSSPGNTEGWYGDGWLWIVAPASVSQAEVIELLGDGSTIPEEQASARGWAVYATGGPGLYEGAADPRIALWPLMHGGRLYLLALPTVWTTKPDGVLLRPTPHGKYETLCEYTQVEVNF